MKVRVLSEHGYEEAVRGLSMSFHIPGDDIVRILGETKLRSLCARGEYTGEAKFLESIAVWVEITAPRFWWAEFDTYRVGITKQSESTMHTILKRKLTQEDFEYNINQQHIDYLNGLISDELTGVYPVNLEEEKFKRLLLLKNNIPEGFLQTRIVMLSYKSIRHIINQRMNHKLPQWKTFCNTMLTQLKYPYLLEN
jgi:hypothetical protein